MYSKYTYLDISAGFSVYAKERFKEYSEIEYVILDISKDPVEQGFEAGYAQDVPYQVNAIIVASPIQNDIVRKPVALLCNSPPSQDCAGDPELPEKESGWSVDPCIISQKPLTQQDVISVLDLNSPLFDIFSASYFHCSIDYMTKMQSTGILRVTEPSQIECQDPRYSMVIGVARTI